jgi:glycosyltransferase involved in cell wall biosynthesis
MRILFACEYFPPFAPGGAEWSIYHLARSLAHKGHSIIVVTPNYGTQASEAQDGVEIYRFPFPKKLEQGQQQVPLRWIANPLFYLYFTWQVYCIARSRRIDILHAQHKNALPAVYIAGKMLKKPTFFTIRDIGLYCPFGFCFLQYESLPAQCPGFRQFYKDCFWFYLQHYIDTDGNFALRLKLRIASTCQYVDTKLKRDLARRMNKIVGVSEGILRPYLKLGLFSREQVSVIYNVPPPMEINRFLDCNLESLREQYHIKGEKVILYPGKLSLGKGTYVLLEAADLVAEAFPDVTFVLVGKGQVNVVARKADVHVLPSLPQGEIFKLYALSDIIVLPSISMEAFSRVPLEAAMFSKPTVGTDVGGISEEIQHGITGLIVKKNSPQELAQALLHLLKDDELRTSMGRMARRFVTECFSEEAAVGKLLRLYQEALNGEAREKR